jgi:hypothetical protein
MTDRRAGALLVTINGYTVLTEVRYMQLQHKQRYLSHCGMDNPLCSQLLYGDGNANISQMLMFHYRLWYSVLIQSILDLPVHGLPITRPLEKCL